MLFINLSLQTRPRETQTKGGQGNLYQHMSDGLDSLVLGRQYSHTNSKCAALKQIFSTADETKQNLEDLTQIVLWVLIHEINKTSKKEQENRKQSCATYVKGFLHL